MKELRLFKIFYFKNHSYIGDSWTSYGELYIAAETLQAAINSFNAIRPNCELNTIKAVDNVLVPRGL